MAGRPRKKIDEKECVLDLKSAGVDRHAQLTGAVDLMGMKKYAPLAWLVLNMQERADGAPVACSRVSSCADQLGISEWTMRRGIAQLTAVGLLEVIERPLSRDGQPSNLIAIRWDTVRLFALDRWSDRSYKTSSESRGR